MLLENQVLTFCNSNIGQFLEKIAFVKNTHMVLTLSVVV